MVHKKTLLKYFSFHEKDTESQRIVIENLSKYLLRKNYINNILIGKAQKPFFQKTKYQNQLL
jgi:hypothetical protein